MLLMVAWMALRDQHNPKRYSSALFWALYAVIYLAGEQLPPAAGLLMVLMALIAGFGGVTLGRYGDRTEEERQQRAAPGHKLLIPALLIPVTTVIGSTLFKDVKWDGLFLLDPKT
jgi:uncharacterized membrane protein